MTQAYHVSRRPNLLQAGTVFWSCNYTGCYPGPSLLLIFTVNIPGSCPLIFVVFPHDTVGCMMYVFLIDTSHSDAGFRCVICRFIWFLPQAFPLPLTKGVTLRLKNGGSFEVEVFLVLGGIYLFVCCFLFFHFLNLSIENHLLARHDASQL